MAMSILSVSSLSFLLFMIITISSGGVVKLANGEGVTWCVAKPSSTDPELSANIQYACNNLPNCATIQPGGACYLPNTYLNHASVAMNLYYKQNKGHSWNCDFTKSGLIVLTDPSYGGCIYPSS